MITHGDARGEEPWGGFIKNPRKLLPPAPRKAEASRRQQAGEPEGKHPKVGRPKAQHPKVGRPQAQEPHTSALYAHVRANPGPADVTVIPATPSSSLPSKPAPKVLAAPYAGGKPKEQGKCGGRGDARSPLNNTPNPSSPPRKSWQHLMQVGGQTNRADMEDEEMLRAS